MKNINIKFGIIFLILISSMIPFASSNMISNSKIIYVDDNNTEGPWEGSIEYPYRFIKDGVDNAKDEDTVFVKNGIYTQLITINKSISLIGEDKNKTIIINNSPNTLIQITKDMVTLKGFKIQNGTYGLSLKSNRSTIIDNLFINNVIGIRTYFQTSYHEISRNIFQNNKWKGINLFSSNTIIKNNNFTSIREGISLASSNNIISNNSFYTSGITLWGDTKYPNFVKNNTVNKKHLIYLENESDKLINIDSGQIILVNCNNISVVNQHISNTSLCIQLSDSNYCNIHDNFLQSYSGASLKLYNSKNNSIIRNVMETVIYSDFEMMENTGLFLERSCENIIKNNILSKNNKGVVLTDSNKNIISKNGIQSNQFNGIIIELSHENIITNNNFIENPTHATFTLSINNNWIENYWGRPRFLPKLIFGILERNGNFFPFINIDWNPAKEPYDI